MSTTEAAIYCRISRDRAGDELGVARQERECRALADARGWTVAEVFTDDDTSAYTGGPRPAYDRLLDDLRAGRFGAVIAWHPDRLHRHPRDLEEFIDAVETARVDVATCRAGDIDLETPSGRTVARIVGAVARGESEHRADRLRSKHAELAERGRWKGGPRPYGYRPVGDGQLEIVDAEAEVVRDVADRVLAGEKLYRICADLNDQGLHTARGARWRTQTLRRIITSPTTAGRRSYHGHDVGPATWPPILDEDTWHQVRALIIDPDRSRRAPARIALLSGGIARCGRCGTELHTARKSTGVRVLRCIRSVDKDGCGKLEIVAEPVEDLVVDQVLALDGPGLAAVAAGGEPVDVRDVTDELAEVERKLAALAEQWADGTLDELSWVSARRRLDERRRVLRRQRETVRRPAVLARYLDEGGVLRDEWPTMSLHQRRAVIEAVIEAVIVGPATRRGPRFDPHRVSITWR